MNRFFDDFEWHSSVKPKVDGYTNFHDRFPNSKKARRMFIASSADPDFLVHKTTRSLWRVSEDGQSILAVFPTDVLSEDQADEIMRENDGK